MKETEIIDSLSEVFLTVFGRKMSEINFTMSNTAEWDSLRHIALIMEIEKKFDIQIDYLDIIEMVSVKNIIAIIKKYKNSDE